MNKTDFLSPRSSWSRGEDQKDVTVPLPTISSSDHCHLLPGFALASLRFPMEMFDMPTFEFVTFSHLHHLSFLISVNQTTICPVRKLDITCDISLFLIPISIIQVLLILSPKNPLNLMFFH